MKSYQKAVNVMRSFLITEIQRTGKSMDSNIVSNEEILKPSIFDTEDIKELKGLFGEMLIKV